MRVLLDTTVLIDMLRGKEQANVYLRTLRMQPDVSVVSISELYRGVREGRERIVLDRIRRSFEVVPVDEQIAEQAGLLGRQYFKSHGTGFADALIAASALQVGATLVTHNRRHFPMLHDLIVPY